MRIDLKLSEDGDLVLGQQQVNEKGEYLYYQDVSESGGDPFLTTEPEDNIPVRDVDVVYEDTARLQLLNTRVRTDSPDFRGYPEVGANLSDLIGQPNNQRTAEEGVEMIRETLTYDGAFDSEHVEIDAIPVSKEELLFDIKLTRNEPYRRYVIVFNFDVGILNQYEIS